MRKYIEIDSVVPRLFFRRDIMMGIYHSKQWLADIDEVLASLPELAMLANKRILVTGATGLICSAVVDIIMRFNEKKMGSEIRVMAAGRTKRRFLDRFSCYAGKPYLCFVQYDATKENKLDFECDYIIHGASNSSPNKYVSEAVETMADNFIGMKNLLDFARLYGVRRALYISSSEVYGKKENSLPYSEDEYGYVDLLVPRSSYAVSKRATETLCVSYASEYDLETVIVRPGHIYGPTASPNDNRISSAWAYDVAQGKDIIMKSDGAQIRSYCYCLDCASAILKVLIDGENCHAYNISNPNAIVTIKEMAQILTKSGNVALRMELPSDAEKQAFNPMSNSSLNSESLQKLGWEGLFDAERGFTHTVKILKEMMKE